MGEKDLNEGEAEKQAREEKAAQVYSEMVYKGKKVSLRVDHISLESGHKYLREVVVHTGAVVMIPVDQVGKIILVKQWRRAVGQVILELPAGTLEENEDPQECAQRELQEEIGYIAGKMTGLGGFFSAPGFSTEYLHLFLAEDLRVSQLEPDAHEKIEVLRKTPEEALKMIENGEIRDAKSIAGITRYYLSQILKGK